MFILTWTNYLTSRGYTSNCFTQEKNTYSGTYFFTKSSSRYKLHIQISWSATNINRKQCWALMTTFHNLSGLRLWSFGYICMGGVSSYYRIHYMNKTDLFSSLIVYYLWDAYAPINWYIRYLSRLNSSTHQTSCRLITFSLVSSVIQYP